MKAKENFELAGYGYEELLNLKYFSIKKLYHRLRGDFPKVERNESVVVKAPPSFHHYNEYLVLSFILVSYSFVGQLTIKYFLLIYFILSSLKKGSSLDSYSHT